MTIAHHQPEANAGAPAKCPYTATKNAVARFFGIKPAATGTQTASPPTPLAGLHEALKSRTWPLHQRAEHHPFQAAIMRGGMSRSGYVAQLEQTLLVHRVLERHLAGRRRHVPALTALVRDHHFRVPHAEADLAALGGSTHAPPRPCTTAFIAEIDAAADARPHALVGYLYVLEGSTNGAKFIAKALARALGIADGHGLSYQDPHGDLQRPRWTEFKAALNTLDLTPAQAEDVVAAAESLFTWTIALFDELAAAFPDVAAPAVLAPTHA